MQRITTDPAVCTGCRACEMACSFFHTDQFSSDLSRIRIAKDEGRGLDFPVVCQACSRAPCVQVCPTGALSRSGQDGHIQVDDSECIGCQLCAEACPHEAINFHPATGVALICDLCGGEPRCVDRCVFAAIRYEREDRHRARRRLRLARRLTGEEGVQ